MAKAKRVAECVDCGIGITRASGTGRCRACLNKFRAKDPAYRAAQKAGIRRKWDTDPAFRAKMNGIAAENSRKALENPEWRAYLRERGKKLYHEVLKRPDVMEKCKAAVRANSYKVREARIGWCPPEWRDEYYHLTVTKRFLAAEAKRIILAQIEQDRKRKAAAAETLSPFERQERALARGAKLVANDTAPSLANPGDFGEARWANNRG